MWDVVFFRNSNDRLVDAPAKYVSASLNRFFPALQCLFKRMMDIVHRYFAPWRNTAIILLSPSMLDMLRPHLHPRCGISWPRSASDYFPRCSMPCFWPRLVNQPDIYVCNFEQGLGIMQSSIACCSKKFVRTRQPSDLLVHRLFHIGKSLPRNRLSPKRPTPLLAISAT